MKPRDGSSTRIFETDHLQQNLKARTVRGGSLTVGAQAVRFFLRLVSLATLARLLTPEDYGLFGMTLVVSGFVSVMRDGGLIHATVQKESITHPEVSLLFWINIALGAAIALILVGVSPLVAAIFGEPRLTSLLCALSTTFVVGGCAVQHKALLRRQMKFGSLAVIEIASMACGIVAGITMAVADFGYWSLAGIEIVSGVTTLLLAWLLLPWRPAAPKWNRDILATLRFGGNIVAFNIINYVSRNADNALIGWYWGAITLGLYSRAHSALMLPIRNINAPFSAVAIPVLSRANNDPPVLKRYFAEALAVVSAVVIPIVACATVFAEDLVRIWLGERWMATADLFRLLAVPAMLFGASQPVSWLYVVLNRTHLLRNVGFVTAPLNVLAFCIGLPFGPEGVAIGYTISSCLLYLPLVRYAVRGTEIRMMDVFRTWKQPALAAATAIGAGVVVKFLVLPQQPQLLTAIVSIAVFGLVYILMMAFAFGWRTRVAAWYSRKAARRGLPTPVCEPAG